MTGGVTALVEEFIEMRRGLGYRLSGQERYLRAFAGSLDRAGHHGPIPMAATLEWATSSSSADPCSHARRLNVVRGFLGHLSALDGATEAPTPGLLGPAHHRRPPHIYSDDEISDLLLAAASLTPHGGLRPCCYVTLFSLLACTGLRISEALALSREDVDLVGGVLTVRSGKGGRTRLVPLHASALAPLRDYATRAEQYPRTAGAEESFFRTERSEHLSYEAVRSTFGRLRRRLGWDDAARARVPRIHDLRHRMAVRRIQSWHAQGVDVDRKMAVLAAYLGHVLVADVYWYLSAVPELMSIVADRFEAYASDQQGGV